MGRSTASCFKIIGCGGSNSVDEDNVGAPESKGSSDKRGWSFRKRSARHRVLSNSAIPETPPSGNKESPESPTINFQMQANSIIQEKSYATQWTDEKSQLPTSVKSTLLETIAPIVEDAEVDVNPDESIIIVIQASIRGFLAQRVLVKRKNIVKLQAAVRGHLVRRHAVGTLRCIQAIVKMQALVRARRACLAVERFSVGEKLDGMHGKDNYNSKLLGKEISGTKTHLKYDFIKKLLSNRYAHQLLESTPRTEPINIKCDPARSDSAWKWLERWMSVSSTEVEHSLKPKLNAEQQELEKVEHPDIHPSEVCESTDLKFTNGEAAVPSESEENVFPCDAIHFDFQACRPTSSAVSHNLEQPQPDDKGIPNSKENSIGSLPYQTKHLEMKSQEEPNSLSCKPEMESEQSKRSLKRSATEEAQNEGKKFSFGSRTASNPVFIGVQSKFEELSSIANSVRSTRSSNKDVGVGGSECGTELSISSTLDSLDRSELGDLEVELEPKVLVEKISSPNRDNNQDVEAKGEPIMTGTDISNPIPIQPMKLDYINGVNEDEPVNSVIAVNISSSITIQPVKLDDINGVNDNEPINSVIAVDLLHGKQKPEESSSYVQTEPESEMGHQVHQSSPEASPRSQINVPESQGTPSSQVSAKTKKTRSDKSGSDKKHRSFSTGKRSPLNSNHDSGARSSLEQLSRDHKTEKHRNSFGSARPEHFDQEPRDSSSSNSLPKYMQPTESARAKAHANSSPILSPDVQDKDNYIKKRHSLPGSNGRQRSPRIQRSTSQAQPSAKGNGMHSPHEKKWQR